MNSHYQHAANILLNNRQKGEHFASLSKELLPHNCEQALAIQSEMVKLRHDQVAGWKCLLPLSEDQYVVAPIFADTLQSGNQCTLLADNGKARIEPEIAFILGVDLPANKTGYSDAEIDSAIQRCHMALELMQDRFHADVTPSFPEKLADCLVNQGLFIGPEINKKKAYLASEFEINIEQNKTRQTFKGKHPNKLPQKPLYWLINFMSARGISFKAGEAIITGSYAGIVDVEFGQPTHIEYIGLGQYTLQFSEK